MNLRNILLNENSHSQNKEYIPYDFIYAKLQETRLFHSHKTNWWPPGAGSGTLIGDSDYTAVYMCQKLNYTLKTTVHFVVSKLKFILGKKSG